MKYFMIFAFISAFCAAAYVNIIVGDFSATTRGAGPIDENDPIIKSARLSMAYARQFLTTFSGTDATEIQAEIKTIEYFMAETMGGEGYIEQHDKKLRALLAKHGVIFN